MGSQRLNNALTAYLGLCLLLAIPGGHLFLHASYQDLGTLIFATLSSGLWLAGALWPLYDPPHAFPPGLCNGAAAVCALVTAASAVPYPKWPI